MVFDWYEEGYWGGLILIWDMISIDWVIWYRLKWGCLKVLVVFGLVENND